MILAKRPRSDVVRRVPTCQVYEEFAKISGFRFLQRSEIKYSTKLLYMWFSTSSSNDVSCYIQYLYENVRNEERKNFSMKNSCW